CVGCHGSISHTTYTHATTVAGSIECTDCHTATAGTASGVPVNPSSNKVHDACTTCHSATGALKALAEANDPATKATVIAMASGNCVVCHGSVSHTDMPHDVRVSGSADCIGCHTATAGTVSGIPVNPAANKVHDACTTCHTSTGALKSVAVANDPATAATVIAMTTGNCVTCHGAISHTTYTHALTVGNSSECTGCHTATAGTASGVPVNPSNNKVHDACTTCHTSSGALKSVVEANDPATAATVTAMPATGNCVGCHGSVTHTTYTHVLTIAGSSECTGCHTATAGTASGAPVDLANNKVHDACTTCHSATGALKSVAAANDPATAASVIAMAAGNCVGCHGQYFVSHANANHVALVSMATNCADCHTGNAGTTTTAPVNGANNKIHDACSSCHDANGVLKVAYGRAQAMPNGGAGSNNGGGTCEACHTLGFNGFHQAVAHTTMVASYVNCSTCHTAVGNTVSPSDPKVHDSCSACHGLNGRLIGSASGKNGGDNGGTNGGGNCFICHGEYFNSHTHAHTVTQTANDKSQAAPGSLCSTCHIPSPSGLTTWASVYAEHLGVCSTCHSSVRAEVITAISVKANPTACLSCHSAKTSPATHGGHDATHFATHASCSGCHSDGGLGVVAGIHKNSCTMCHATASGGTGTAKVGVNGDGNALLGIGAAPHASVTCLTCHNVANVNVTPASIGGIHHNNTGSVTYNASNCIACHANSDHVNLVKDTPANCKGCHSLTPALAGKAAPVAAGDPKVHDDCTTCHRIVAAPAYNGTLVTAPGTKGVTTMNPGTAATNDGGGNCVQCHTATKKAMHHTSSLTTAGTCQSCHDGTVATGVGPASPSQLACKTCHVNINNETGQIVVYSLRLGNGNGLRPTKLTNIKGTTAGVTTAGVVTSHTIAGVTGSAINDYRMCFDCHGGRVYNNGVRQAPVVAPFHGFPGSVVRGSIVDKVWWDSTAIAGYTRKPVLAGGLYNGVAAGAVGSATEGGWGSGVNAMPINEASGNALPLVFQFYHPGHRNFKRFSTPGTAQGYPMNNALTGRNAATRTNNARLYYGSSGHWANASAVVSNNSVINLALRSWFDSTTSAFPTTGQPYPAVQPGAEKMGYGGSAVATQYTTAATSSTAGGQWATKGYTLSFTAPYTRFNVANKPADTTQIPYFTALASPNDRVFVNSAEVNASGQLIVIAKNDQGCGLLSVTTQPGAVNRGAMTLNSITGYCEKTVAGIAPIPTTVDVRSTGTGAPSVLGFPVVNNALNPGAIALSASTYSVGEAGGTVTVTVTRNGGSGAVAVNYVTSNGTAAAGSDYTATSGTLNWADGDTTAKTFNISIINDAITEANETVNITLSGNTGGATLGSPSTAVLTIIDDDQPGTVNITTTSASVSEAVGAVIISASRTAGSAGAVTATVTASGTASNGADYTLSSTVFSWASGDTADKAITINVVDDALTETSETVILTVTSTTGGLVNGTNLTVTTTIVDNDSPGTVNITTTDASVSEAVGAVIITASRTGGSVGAVTATVTATGTASNGADYTLSSSVFSWAAGDSANKTITINVVDDAVTESSETIILTVTSTTGGLVNGADVTVTTTITDNDAPAWTNYEYHMNTGTGTDLGTNGSDNLDTGSVGASLTATNTTNEFRDLAEQTAIGSGTESGTTRNRIRSGAAFTGTWEYARVYTPAYGTATTIAANATARVSAYLANAATSGDFVKVDIYEYNNTTGFVGGVKGTATVNMANTTASQQVNLTLNNPQFNVASGNRVVLVISFTDNGSGRPALLWGSTFSTTPSGPTYFTLSEGN
ncbi:MAG: hypothetical protein FP815_13305, partial [Desulfobulbaceae bacterium]|nr:hypothetical protein [Desulfobulbaceae bacterium]